jgi:ribose 5-phosphate isomerase A
VDADIAKRAPAQRALDYVEDGMVVGLGTGSTVRWFILGLGDRVRQGLRVSGVPTSEDSATLAVQNGIPLTELGRNGLDVAVDGADVVDSELRLIKGGGGAMVREKIVAVAARRFVVVVDETKIRPQLGGRLPVELIPFGVEHTLALLEGSGATFELRRDATGGLLKNDNHNLVADGDFEVIEDAFGLAAWLEAIPGVVGHGLFLGMADVVLVGHTDGTVAEMTAPGGGDRV